MINRKCKILQFLIIYLLQSLSVRAFNTDSSNALVVMCHGASALLNASLNFLNPHKSRDFICNLFPGTNPKWHDALDNFWVSRVK